MKKTLAIILAALLAASSVVLTSCKKTDGTSNDYVTNNTHNTDNTDASPETNGKIFLNDALARIEEIEPKNELDKEILVTIDSHPVSGAAVRNAVLYPLIYYGYTSAPDEETLSSIIAQSKEECVLNSAIINLCDKYNISLTEEEFEADFMSIIEMTKTQLGDLYEYQVDRIGSTPNYYAECQVLNLYYNKLFEYLLGENGVSEKKQEVYDATLAQMKESDYVRAKHILVAFPEDIEKDEEGNIVESAKAETLARANEVLEKVNAGEDFDELIKTYGEDPGMEAYPEGYFFTKGKMVAEFEKTAYALEVGETSGLVETPFGYHIIRKLDIDDPSLVNSELYRNNASNTMYELLLDISSKYNIVYADNYDERVNTFIADYIADANAAGAN